MPIRDAEAFELVIAEINVQHGIGAVTASLIKDTRMDEQKFGLVRDNIERISTQVLYDQFQDFMDINESEFNSILETARNDYEEIKKDSEDQVKIVSNKIEELDNMVMNGDFDGAFILSGLDDPMDDIGKDKDLYVNESTYHLFLKENDAWIDKGTLKGADGNNRVFVGSDILEADAKILLLKTENQPSSVGYISLDAILDQNGNAAVSSDIRLITYDKKNLQEYIEGRVYKTPEGYVLSERGIIKAPDWHVSDKAMDSLIDLCVDVCKRNGIAKLNYTGDVSGNLTRHNMFTVTVCPGPYLQSKLPYIAAEVNKKINGNGTTASSAGCKYGVGMPVCTCRIWSSSSDTGVGYKGDWSGKITRVILGARHPYLINDGTGWTDDASIDADPHIPGEGSATSFKPASIAVGSNVVVTNPVDYNGIQLGVSGVYKVMELRGVRAVIGRNGQVTCAIHINNLTLA